MPENSTYQKFTPYVPIPLLLVIASYWFNLFAPITDRWSAVPTFDSVFFIKLAEQILNLNEFGWLGYHEPFFYSLTTAILTVITGDLYVSAVLISKISVVLLPTVVFLLASTLFNRRIGFAASLLILFFPHIRAIADTSQSEAFSILLVTTSTYLLWLAWRRQNHALALGAGLFFALSYLTRSEGLILFLLLSGSLLLSARLKHDGEHGSWKIILVAMIAFAVISTPYITYLSKHYGTLTVGTKTSAIYFWVRDKCFNDPDPIRSEWGLNSRGELNIISMKSSELLAYWSKDIPRSISVYVKNFSEQMPGKIPNDGAIKHYPQIYPLYLAVPLVAGLVLHYRKRTDHLQASYMLSAFLLLFVYPLLTGGWWRYLINLLPFFLILTAVALDEIATVLLHTKKSHTVLAAVIALISLYHIWVVAWQFSPKHVVNYQKTKSSFAEETKRAGAWARQIIPANATYMAEWTRLPFYLQGNWIATPRAGLSDVLRYAHHNRVQYMLVESADAVAANNLARAAIPGAVYIATYSSQTINYYCTILRLL